MTIKQDYEAFTAVWRLYRKYSEEPITEFYWDAVVGEVDVIQTRHPTELCRNLLIAVLEDLERKDKRDKKRIEN